MSDEDKAKAEKEFLEQGAKDKERVEQATAANRMLEAVMEELHQKHKGDEEKSRREFLRRCKEDAAFREAVLRSMHDDMWRMAHPFEQQ
jgi:hypothetical protein